MRPLLIVATAWALVWLRPAFAPVGTVTPSLGVTSSLGTDPSVPVGANGLQVGAAPTVSPVPNGVTGTITIPSTSSGAGACSTVTTSPLGTFGSPATDDRGGMAIRTSTPATGGMSGGTPSSGISTSTAISATSGLSTSSGMLETSGLTGMGGSGSRPITAPPPP